MQNNLNTKLQNHRHPESSLRHSKSSLRHPESLFPVILSEIPVILSEAKDLFWSSSWTLHSLRSLRVTNLCHPEPSLRHPERSEGSQETKNTHINIGTGEDISIKELTDPSKLHALGWKHKVEFSDGIKTMYEWYLNNK